MLPLSVDSITALISQYEYIAIFVLMLLESIILPIPSEIILPFTGFLIALNKINPYLGAADAVAASVLGSIIGYYLGLFLGVDVFLNYSRKAGLKDTTYYSGIAWIKRYGVYFAFFSKLLPAIRSIASIICGAFKMDFKRFIIYSTLGIAIWSGALIYIGYSLTSRWMSAGYDIASITPYIVIIAIAVLLYFLRKPIMNLFRSPGR